MFPLGPGQVMSHAGFYKAAIVAVIIIPQILARLSAAGPGALNCSLLLRFCRFHACLGPLESFGSARYF